MSVGTITLLVVAFLLGMLIVMAFKKGKRGARAMAQLSADLGQYMQLHAELRSEATAANVTQVHVEVPSDTSRSVFPDWSEEAWHEFIESTDGRSSGDVQRGGHRRVGRPGDGLPLGGDPRSADRQELSRPEIPGQIELPRELLPVAPPRSDDES